MTIIDRLRGSLVGLAVGDALGAAVEFKTPGSFEPVTDYRAGGPHGLEPGEWTDDTSMALALADSIVEVGWNLNHQMECYLTWRDEGEYSVNGRCFDIGITVGGALRRYQETGDARSSASSEEHASGNGSIMRLAPVPIRYAYLYPTDIHELARTAEQSSLPTHASPQCRSSCRYMAVAMAALIHGQPRDVVLSPDWEVLQRLRDDQPFHPEVDEILNGSFRNRQPPEIRGTGYVVHTLEAALWAFHDANNFEEAVLRVVNLGEDADTTGAVCGQFAGAFWGESGIPEHWRDGLAKPEMIEEALCGLLGHERPSKPCLTDENCGEDDVDDELPDSGELEANEEAYFDLDDQSFDGVSAEEEPFSHAEDSSTQDPITTQESTETSFKQRSADEENVNEQKTSDDSDDTRNTQQTLF